MSTKDQILLEIAEGNTYDSEYDGRTYTRCAYCGCSQDNREQHDDSCLMLRARVALGKVWTNKIEREQREREQARLDHEKQLRDEYNREIKRKAYIRQRELANSVACEFCGVMMHKNAIANHQKTSHKCLKIQGKSVPTQQKKTVVLASIRTTTSLTTNGVTTRFCLHCHKAMVGAHPNKKFCSNSGVGNCKDAHHNKHNPRGLGSILQAAREARREERDGMCEDDDFEHGHIFASGWDGHGQE